jgi:hypothetical protein
VILKAKIPKHIETLIRKMERSPDFGYDDEEVALTKYCEKNGVFWCWNDNLFKPEVLITDNKNDIDEMLKKR